MCDVSVYVYSVRVRSVDMYIHSKARILQSWTTHLTYVLRSPLSRIVAVYKLYNLHIEVYTRPIDNFSSQTNIHFS
jgi:hypothetical protein